MSSLKIFAGIALSGIVPALPFLIPMGREHISTTVFTLSESLPKYFLY
jgi:hypothetical protein